MMRISQDGSFVARGYPFFSCLEIWSTENVWESLITYIMRINNCFKHDTE